MTQSEEGRSCKTERGSYGANEMAQYVRACCSQASQVKLEFDFQNSHGRRESTPVSCPLPSTYMHAVSPYKYTHTKMVEWMDGWMGE